MLLHPHRLVHFHALLVDNQTHLVVVEHGKGISGDENPSIGECKSDGEKVGV